MVSLCPLCILLRYAYDVLLHMLCSVNTLLLLLAQVQRMTPA